MATKRRRGDSWQYTIKRAGLLPQPVYLSFTSEAEGVHLRLANTVIECLPWQECVQRYDRPGTQFYLDPPYWETEGYGVEFPFAEYEAMAELMRTSVGRFVVSINDHPEIRKSVRGLRPGAAAARIHDRRRAGEREEVRRADHQELG